MPVTYDVAKLGEPAPPLHDDEEEEDNDDDINKNLLALPARPVRGSLALWLPRAATVAGLGVTWLASRQQQQQTGANVAALALPFFGTANPRERRVASYISWNLTSAFMIWTVEGWRGGNAGTVLAVQVLFCPFFSSFASRIHAIISCTCSRIRLLTWRVSRLQTERVWGCGAGVWRREGGADLLPLQHESRAGRHRYRHR